MYEAQLESARRTSERERAAAAVTKRTLDEARAELAGPSAWSQGTVDKENVKSAEERDADAAKIRKAEEQLVLLRESNKLLREEAEKTARSLQEAQKELDAKMKSAAPTEAKVSSTRSRQGCTCSREGKSRSRSRRMERARPKSCIEVQYH